MKNDSGRKDKTPMPISEMPFQACRLAGLTDRIARMQGDNRYYILTKHKKLHR